LSVRKPADLKPLICFGQDECIFKQFTFTPKAWTAPDGQKSMIPKDDGLGVMISAFVSREFGFGYYLSPEDLEKVNEAREGKHCSDEDAAKKIKGNSSMKDPLTQSPFVVEFEHGANNQGHWDYDHMIIQFEDCVDIVKTLHPDFKCAFLFYHSWGHDRQQPDGLSAPKVNKYFGGAQPATRKSKMETDEHVGTFEATLQVGDCRHMFYQDGDSGPHYLSDADREASKLDCPTGETSTKKRRKDALEKDLRAKGVSAKGNRDALVKLCQQNGVPHEITAPKIKKGWVGKPKGMLQMLWERGFIDPSRAVDLIPGTSLRMMMSSLMDFIEEETLLQFHGKTLGVLVDRSPKCHPEVAGEGIECSWGCAKGKYRRLALSSERKKENFRKWVSQCLDRNDALTFLERQRMFSKQARQYMLAHHCIEMRKKERKLAATKESNPDVKGVKEEEEKKHEMSACLVEKIIKKFKSHRGATDFDSAYIDAIVNDMKSSIRRDNSRQE
jgi:hypothetical protein